MNRLKEVMLLLIANDGPLGPEWADHQLKGNKAPFRECHVGGDFLLIYRIEATQQVEMVVFVRSGTHAELFNE
jgi:mRNA interferase YafQ